MNNIFSRSGHRWLRTLVLFVVLFSSSVFADKFASSELEPIQLQLRWHHQFQFAGYYAAKEKGFYQQAGFDVTLVAGSPEHEPVAELLAGRAQYATGNSEVLFARLQGAPVVALAVIFQHSPSVLMARKDSGIQSPKDLIGKRVMSVGGQADVSIFAMIKSAGVTVDQVEFIKSSYQVEDLIDKKTDAFKSYLTNEPFYLVEKGVKYNILNPRDYGVDFYSDILFTSEQEAAENPERVERFKQATLRGWKYALKNPEEVVQIIREKYNETKSVNHLRYEALSAHGLIMPELVEVGYINPQRIVAMAKVFVQQGLVANLDHLDGFVFSLDDELSDEVYSILIAVCVVLVVALLVAVVLALFNYRLQHEVDERRSIEEQLKLLADTDYLTQLLNRRAFAKCFNRELVRAQRYGDKFSVLLIDLDFFKRINDDYGHDAGDRVLVSVAELLKKDTRESDTCGRFGGEEFILLLPKTPVSEAAAYANRLCQHIRENAVDLGAGKSVNISASIGVAEWSPKDKGESTIIRADKALYKSKSGGRNQVVIWNESL